MFANAMRHKVHGWASVDAGHVQEVSRVLRVRSLTPLLANKQRECEQILSCVVASNILNECELLFILFVCLWIALFYTVLAFSTPKKV